MQPLTDRAALWGLEYTADESKTLFDRSHDGYLKIVETAVNFDSNTDSSSSSLKWPPKPLPEDLVDLCWRDSGIEIGEEAEKILTLEQFPWRSHDNIALIDGTASVAGTCTGIGSTTAFPKFAAAKKKETDKNINIDDETTSTSSSSDEIENSNNHKHQFPFICNYCGDEKGHPAKKNRKKQDDDRPFTQDEDEVLVAHLCKILVMGSDRVEAVESIAHELGRTSFEVVCRLQYLTNSSLKLTEGLADEKDVEDDSDDQEEK